MLSVKWKLPVFPFHKVQEQDFVPFDLVTPEYTAAIKFAKIIVT